MIKKIYYWDGKLISFISSLWELVPCIPGLDKYGDMKDETNLIQIDAASGWKSCNKQLTDLKSDDEINIVVTNEPSALCFDWFECKDILDVHERVYLYSKVYTKWLPIECFTDKELRFAHNLEKMYKAGVFDEEEE